MDRLIKDKMIRMFEEADHVLWIRDNKTLSKEEHFGMEIAKQLEIPLTIHVYRKIKIMEYKERKRRRDGILVRLNISNDFISGKELEEQYLKWYSGIKWTVVKQRYYRYGLFDGILDKRLKTLEVQEHLKGKIINGIECGKLSLSNFSSKERK